MRQALSHTVLESIQGLSFPSNRSLHYTLEPDSMSLLQLLMPVPMVMMSEVGFQISDALHICYVRQGPPWYLWHRWKYAKLS